jgi:urease accessory protein
MNQGSWIRVLFATCLAVLLLPGIAVAHPGHDISDFGSGWEHPFHGLDHLLAMVTVGLLATRIGGRALWLLPTAFLGFMLIGGLVAAAGLTLPAVEYGIIASVVVLGLVLASTRVAPAWFGCCLAAAFAVFHGHAHAAEMASGGSLAPYAGGFLLATSVLLACGVVGGLLLQRLQSRSLQWLGMGVSAAGLLLLAGVL